MIQPRFAVVRRPRSWSTPPLARPLCPRKRAQSGHRGRPTAHGPRRTRAPDGPPGELARRYTWGWCRDRELARAGGLRTISSVDTRAHSGRSSALPAIDLTSMTSLSSQSDIFNDDLTTFSRPSSRRHTQFSHAGPPRIRVASRPSESYSGAACSQLRRASDWAHGSAGDPQNSRLVLPVFQITAALPQPVSS